MVSVLNPLTSFESAAKVYTSVVSSIDTLGIGSEHFKEVEVKE
jgi:hypothetical protein